MPLNSKKIIPFLLWGSASLSYADLLSDPVAPDLSPGAYSAPSQNSAIDEMERTWFWNPQSAPSKNVKNGNSIAPIVGYDPTYGVLVGGAFFRGNKEDPVTDMNILAMATFHHNFAGDIRLKLWTPEDWQLGLDFGATQFYDSYFGEGNQTNPAQQVKIQNYKYYVNPSIGFRFTEHFSTIVRSELRYRHETGVNGTLGATVFGTEFTPIFGLAFVWDDRDKLVDPKEGKFIQLRADLGPSQLSTRKPAEEFIRTLLEMRLFYPVAKFLILATQIQGGASLGEPGILYRYNLGGSTDMRGYQSNRLRGRHFYEAQFEARVSFLEWLGVVAFGGLGDVADVHLSDFSKPKWAYGAGLRIGVPPDFVAKVRLDFGVAPDEKCFYLSFNEAF